MGEALVEDPMSLETVPELAATAVDREGRPAVAGSVGWRMQAGATRYVLIEEVGRGGMGRVLRAYDPKLQREVAIKEVHGHGLDHDATARLVVEARAMAKLSHPHVVAVFDVEEVGSHDLLLVMEYVRGTNLRAWLTARQRSWQAVLEVFVQAGQGLVAAHAAGLLHRDFKPGNVLVSDDGKVKVTDFGLAKMTDGSSTLGLSSVDERGGDGAITETGMIMGTPRYMAPEQHCGRTLTPAVDQYAFCVALWEALCGRPPFEGAQLVGPKIKGPPAWAHRSVPRAIGEALVRGLSPRVEDRWPSMAALLKALTWDPNWLRNRCLGVLRLGAGLSLGGLAWYGWSQSGADRCTGASAQLGPSWNDERSEAVKAAVLAIDKPHVASTWQRMEQGLDAYANHWVAMHTETCEATERGEQSTAVMDLRMACLHRASIELRAVTDQLVLANDQVVRNADALVASLPALSRCADLDALAEQVEPPRPDDVAAVEQVRVHLAMARAARTAGRHSEASQAVEAARTALAGVDYGPARTEVVLEDGAVLSELGQPAAAEEALVEALGLATEWGQRLEQERAATLLMQVVGYQLRKPEEALRYAPLAEGLAAGSPEREAAVIDAMAAVMIAQGKYDEAEPLRRRALELRQQVYGPEHSEVARSHNNLVKSLSAQGKLAEANAELRQAIVSWERAHGPGHPELGTFRTNLASVLHRQGKYAEAEVEVRAAMALIAQTLGVGHPDMALAHEAFSEVLESQGKYEEAEAEARAALVVNEQALGAEHPDVAAGRNALAGVLMLEGKLAEAEVELQRALAVQTRRLSPEHPELALTRDNLAAVLASQGKLAEAEALLRRGLAARERLRGPDHPDVATTRYNLARVLIGQERHAEAESLMRAALASFEASLGSEHPQVGTIRNGLAHTLTGQGKYEEAEAELRRAIAHWEKGLGPEHPHVVNVRHVLGAVLLELHRPVEALELAEQSWRGLEGEDPASELRADAAFVLARAMVLVHRDAESRRRARALAEEALAVFEAIGERRAEDAAEIRTWLGKAPR